MLHNQSGRLTHLAVHLDKLRGRRTWYRDKTSLPGWVLSWRLVRLQNGELAPGELSLRPSTRPPASGITTRLLRRVKFPGARVNRELWRAIRAIRREIESELQPTNPKRGAPKHSRNWYFRAIERYERTPADQKHQLAKELGYRNTGALRTMVSRYRKELRDSARNSAHRL